MTVAEDIAELGRKMGALEIILTCPPWPKREDLTETGQRLFDLMVADAKPYALSIVDDAFGDALVTLCRWSAALNTFIDATMISGNPPAERMVEVYRHYADAFGTDFNLIHRAD